MTAFFPFDLSSSSAFYVIVYIVTFALHQAFMHYVLAGTWFIACVTAFRGGPLGVNSDHRVLDTLRDWLPFALSAAITAGVAPLLFVQVLYQHAFYTANLLLWWRFALIVPTLIVAFYLLYLIKSQMFQRWPRSLQAIISAFTASLFTFTGFCWTANHLVGINQAAWTEVYLSGHLPFSAATILLRMLIWIAGSFCTMPVIAAWQVSNRLDDSTDHNQYVRPLARMAIIGQTVSLLAAMIYLSQCDGAARKSLLSIAFLPYFVFALVGSGLFLGAWIIAWKHQVLQLRNLISMTIGLVLNLFAVSAYREGLRVHLLDIRPLADKHAALADEHGFFVFIFASIIVTALIVWCIRLVQPHTGSAHIHEETGATRDSGD